MASPPGSPPPAGVQRPMSAMIRPNRSSSRMSMSSRQGGGSRASDEDGKTAVKVAVRVRPPLKHTDPGFELVPQRFRGSTCKVTNNTSLSVESAQGRKLFVFDRVFSEDIDQEGIWDYLSDSVNSFIQGYNVSILAYGQSGAGKSYTMGTTGAAEQSDPNVMGVIPRAASLLFEKLTGSMGGRSGIRPPSRFASQSNALPNIAKPSSEKSWQMTATYVEIYNEHLRDLLVPDTVPLSERGAVTIREDVKGRILLTGLKQISINSIDDLLQALDFGSSIRQTDATAVNARSSRSHAVFSLNLVQKKTQAIPTPVHQKRHSVPIEAMSGSENFVTTDSKLHFVDLAGSERLKNTGATGERAKEGISINAGLASLGKVISQLSSRTSGAHVSYRDSKLTRLLQDSLGGNAITYMVACVNPAEFHLSETLNTVQYAQRARAIQSKPQIQQVSDDSDKQAIIERLRAEISFLRDQIRLSERTERKASVPQERSERQHEREIELQNQLLDSQENYNALSQRHAKLISEITKARDNPAESEDIPLLKDTIGDSALERLKRSNSFAEAVEQVVLEYEKTIESLESSLSNTRSSLALCESNLNEKETKIAYMETINHQLQSRIQKSNDREANNETYLRELEARVDGVASGEEKSTAIIQDLRKELARTKEHEATCEDYISSLEERLADADQDRDLMQREIDRLEHVVERQRSIGKLDNLLYELDNIRQADVKSEPSPITNGHHSKKPSQAYLNGAQEGEEATAGASEAQVISDRTEDAVTRIGGEEADAVAATTTGGAKADSARQPHLDHEDHAQSLAQSKFVADKLEAVTQELFDLRMEHETTVNGFEDMSKKYQMALKTLAEMQDAMEEARLGQSATPSIKSSRPTSFLADAGVNGLDQEDGQPSSSRTLSSELSLLGVSSNVSNLEEASTRSESSETETAQDEEEPIVDDESAHKEAKLVDELEVLKKLNVEKEEHMAALNQSYAQLQETHKETLAYVTELKEEFQKAQNAARPTSPTVKVIRRKSSQTSFNADRANRSFAFLRNMALESFEDRPDLIQNFELNLNAIMTELHLRSERTTALETEIASVRKEMETKMAIISGLTRERSSLKAQSPVDLSLMASMRDQLLESENQLKALQATHAAREQELQEQIDALKTSIHAQSETGADADAPSAEAARAAVPAGTLNDGETNSEQITSLLKEVDEWKSKHNIVMESTKASEQKLLATISELEASLANAEKAHGERIAAFEQKTSVTDTESANFEQERTKHEEVVSVLRSEIEEHKTTAASNAARLVELEKLHAGILSQVEEDSQSRELTLKELETHRGLVANLEKQIEEHKSTVTLHQEGLQTLQDSHAKELEALNAQHATQLEEQYVATATLKEQLKKREDEHQQLQTQLAAAQNDVIGLLKGVSIALGEDTGAEELQNKIEKLVNERKSLTTQHEQASLDLTAVREELEQAKASTTGLEGKVSELKLINDETLRELERVSAKEQKSSRLVEELEDQLSSNYDQHQAATNRLSALQTERQSQLDEALHARLEAERELDESRTKIGLLEAQLNNMHRNSNRESVDDMNPNLRKSTSHNSLPSPPPAIPLPPLPGSPPPGASGMSSVPSPPTSRHQSKDIAQAQLVEDQEARIRTIEKHLFAEKQLTATLEEAMTDLEESSTKVRLEMDGWKKKCTGLEEELAQMKKERSLARHSLQAVEEERNARMRVEAERANLVARMEALNNQKKKNKSKLNCF